MSVVPYKLRAKQDWKKKREDARRLTYAAVARLLDSQLEVKYKDRDQDMTLSPFAALQFQFTFIPQGQGQSKRIGDKVVLKTVEFRFGQNRGNSGGAIPPWADVRFIIYAWTTVSLNPSIPTAAMVCGSPFFPINHDYRSQIHVIWDSGMLHWGPEETGVSLWKRFDMQNMVQLYQNGGLDSTNQIFINILSNDGGIDDFHVGTRVTYVDG